MLVGLETRGSRNGWTLEGSLEELARLARTAGARVVGSISQRLAAPTPSLYIGKGKLEELESTVRDTASDLVIFDDELSPAQQRNLERALGIKVLDRTALILDIFARRANTHEGRLQVELAQQEYLLPRLAGMWPHLERLGGGIGTRGPGETQLESDRRIIQRKIQYLKKEIESVRRQRSLQRKRRSESGLPVIALVGYTNAGKSTLLNALSSADVLVEDKLFATLDPTTRRIALPGGRRAVLTDTVGFIQKLPATLVAAFRATLEGLYEADVIIHVVDVSSDTAAQQFHTVEGMLRDLGVTDKPIVMALNKVDLLGGPVAADDECLARRYLDDLLGARMESAVLVSASKGWGLNRLLQKVDEELDMDSGWTRSVTREEGE